MRRDSDNGIISDRADLLAFPAPLLARARLAHTSTGRARVCVCACLSRALAAACCPSSLRITHAKRRTAFPHGFLEPVSDRGRSDRSPSRGEVSPSWGRLLPPRHCGKRQLEAVTNVLAAAPGVGGRASTEGAWGLCTRSSLRGSPCPAGSNRSRGDGVETSSPPLSC